MASLLEMRLTGGASNSDQYASFGGDMSSYSVVTTPLNNLFKNLTQAQREAGCIHYRCVALLNVGDEAANAIAMYMSNITTSLATQLDFGVGYDTQVIPDEVTSPQYVNFLHYEEGSTLLLPSIDVGNSVRIWIRRVVDAGAPPSPQDIGTISVAYA